VSIFADIYSTIDFCSSLVFVHRFEAYVRVLPFGRAEN